MVRPDGYVKLLDLGLARRTMPEADRLSSSSTAGMPVGTLSYMSPEQCRGEPGTPESDVFSLGIVLFEMATGTHPFERGSLLETLEAMNYLEPPAPSLLVASALQLDELILGMLAKGPSRRPTAFEVARRLESRASSQLARPWARGTTDWAQLQAGAPEVQGPAHRDPQRRQLYLGDGPRRVETTATYPPPTGKRNPGLAVVAAMAVVA